MVFLKLGFFVLFNVQFLAVSSFAVENKESESDVKSSTSTRSAALEKAALSTIMVPLNEAKDEYLQGNYTSAAEWIRKGASLIMENAEKFPSIAKSSLSQLAGSLRSFAIDMQEKRVKSADEVDAMINKVGDFIEDEINK